MFLIPASSLQLVWSPTAQLGVLRALSAGCWFSLPHLISNWLNFLCTKLYNNLTPTLLPASVTNHTHSTRPRSRLYPDIPWPDASVIYTGAFPIVTAWPGSICYNGTTSCRDMQCYLKTIAKIFHKRISKNHFEIIIHNYWVSLKLMLDLPSLIFGV